MPIPRNRIKHKKPKPNVVLDNADESDHDESWAIATVSSIAQSDASVEAELNKMPECILTDSWMALAENLCKMFRLPDLHRHKSLKKIYANFDSYYKRLNVLHSRYSQLPRIRAGIVGIYAKLCDDSLIRDKLFEKGFLKQLFRVLETPSCQRVALLALRDITASCKGKNRLEIAAYALPLVQIIESDSDNGIVEPAVCVLSHTLVTAFYATFDRGQLIPSHPQLVESLPTTRIIKAVTMAAKRPTATPSLIYHAMDLLKGVALQGYKSFKVYPEATQMLIAGLNSKEWELRSGCLQALIRMHSVEADGERDDKYLKIASPEPTEPYTQDIMDVLLNYGLHRCDTFLGQECRQKFREALRQAIEDSDYFTFAAKVSIYIQMTEGSISDGSVMIWNSEAEDFDTDTGLPYVKYYEALPYAAQILRKRGNSLDLDRADILELKFLLTESRCCDSITVAVKAIERNPDQAYWYYAIAMACDPVKGLKAAKQGMKCSQITPYVKYQLMQRAVEHAGNLGLEILRQNPEVGDQKWYEGIALLHSALEDSKTYISEAPPDNRFMGSVLCWYIILMVTIKDVSPDLREIQPAIRQLAFVDKLLEQAKADPEVPSLSTKYKLTQTTIVKWYKQAIETFGPMVDRSADTCSAEDPTLNQSKDKLSNWLEKMELNDDISDFNEVLKVDKTHKHSGIHAINAKLIHYRCGWCGNPSASLRRCTGCKKADYCDARCQKLAWPSHKKDCKPRERK